MKYMLLYKKDFCLLGFSIKLSVSSLEENGVYTFDFFSLKSSFSLQVLDLLQCLKGLMHSSFKQEETVTGKEEKVAETFLGINGEY